MRLALAGLMLTAAWFLTGCLPVTVRRYPEPDLTTALPSPWTPVMFDSIRLLSRGHPWNKINIDGDTAPEYLIFFTYDSGQVGAAIYDLQIGSNRLAGRTPVPQPNEPPGTTFPTSSNRISCMRGPGGLYCAAGRNGK